MKLKARLKFGLEAGSKAISVLASTTDFSGSDPKFKTQDKGKERRSKKKSVNKKGVILFKKRFICTRDSLILMIKYFDTLIFYR